MLIYILRHGIAEDAPPGGSDASRALTAEGKQKLARVLARARRAGVRPTMVLTSPLKRAVETAAIAVEVFGVEQEPVETAALAPLGTPPRVWEQVRAHKAETVLIAGHEPLLGRLAAFLLRCPSLQLDLKKGALVCLDIPDAEPEPHGVLKWMLTPKLAGR